MDCDGEGFNMEKWWQPFTSWLHGFSLSSFISVPCLFVSDVAGILVYKVSHRLLIPSGYDCWHSQHEQLCYSYVLIKAGMSIWRLIPWAGYAFSILKESWNNPIPFQFGTISFKMHLAALHCCTETLVSEGKNPSNITRWDCLSSGPCIRPSQTLKQQIFPSQKLATQMEGLFLLYTSLESVSHTTLDIYTAMENGWEQREFLWQLCWRLVAWRSEIPVGGGKRKQDGGSGACNKSQGTMHGRVLPMLLLCQWEI